MNTPSWFMVLVDSDYVYDAKIHMQEGTHASNRRPVVTLQNKVHAGIKPHGHLMIQITKHGSEEKAIQETSEQYGISTSHLIAFKLED